MSMRACTPPIVHICEWLCVVDYVSASPCDTCVYACVCAHECLCVFLIATAK